MQVREIMTESPACCTPEMNLQEVARMMVEHDCGCIPVVKNKTKMIPVGTITDRDITIRTVAAGQNPVGMKASDIMSIDIATVRPDSSLEECFDVMEDREIRRVLVTDERGALRGIVAQADVVQASANPERTNRVVREISESSPSRTMTMSRDFESRGRESRRHETHRYESHRSESRRHESRKSESLINGKAFLPFLVGLSGAGLLYYLGSRSEESRPIKRPVTSSGTVKTHQTLNAHLTDTQGSRDVKPAVTPTATPTLNAETRPPITGSVRPSSESDDFITKPEIGRIAKP